MARPRPQTRDDEAAVQLFGTVLAVARHLCCFPIRVFRGLEVPLLLVCEEFNEDEDEEEPVEDDVWQFHGLVCVAREQHEDVDGRCEEEEEDLGGVCEYGEGDERGEVGLTFCMSEMKVTLRMNMPEEPMRFLTYSHL